MFGNHFLYLARNLNMKKPVIIKLLIFISIVSSTTYCHAQGAITWTEKQLIEPSELANIITNKKDSIVIVSVGPFNTIPNAINIGMVSEKGGLEKFKTQLNAIDRNKTIVIYCGCCPYEHCPNVRPALDALKQMNFTNYYLLDLPNNIKINWIDKGYPVTKF
jgi:hypothetical protein